MITSHSYPRVLVLYYTVAVIHLTSDYNFTRKVRPEHVSRVFFATVGIARQPTTRKRDASFLADILDIFVSGYFSLSAEIVLRQYAYIFTCFPVDTCQRKFAVSENPLTANIRCQRLFFHVSENVIALA